MGNNISLYYVANVLQYLKKYRCIPNHPDAVKALKYAVKDKLVEWNPEGQWAVNSDGYNFILDFQAR